MLLFTAILFWIAFVIYAVVMVRFISPYYTQVPTSDPMTDFPAVSVIVALRNGARSIPGLMPLLRDQDYQGSLEFLLVDDESTDETAEQIHQAASEDKRFRYVSSVDGNHLLTHKKRALDAGIQQAGGEILLFTDADCRMGPGWVSAMCSYFQDDTAFVIGYSDIKPQKSVVSRFQAVDFLMLQAAAYGTTLLGVPWASTGQNQAYRSRVYHTTEGFLPLKFCLQGDDSLFLQVARKSMDLSVRYADDPRSFVTGRTENSWRRLFRQRIRWSGDANIMWRYNKAFFMMILATFIVNAGLTVAILAGLLGWIPQVVVGTALLGKLVFEWLLYRSGCQVFQKEQNIPQFLLWFFIHIPYVLIMGVMSFFSKQFGWQGRKA